MILFDLETTGLPLADGADINLQPRITEFGAIKLDDDFKETEKLEFLVNPGISLSPQITKITGLTDNDLKDKPPFAGIYNDLCNFFLGEKTIVAHNLPFDRKILKFELERLDKLTKFPWPWDHICTVEVGESVWGKKRKLGDIHEEVVGEKIKGAHRSVNDVEATIRIMKWYRSEGHV